MKNDWQVLARYLTVEALLELKDGWTMAGDFNEYHPMIEQINKALEYLGWEAEVLNG